MKPMDSAKHTKQVLFSVLRTRSDPAANHLDPGAKKGKIITIPPGTVIKVVIKHDDVVSRRGYKSLGREKPPTFLKHPFLNGMLSALDLTGRTTDCVIEKFDEAHQRRRPREIFALENAFGAPAAHLSDAMEIARIDIEKPGGERIVGAKVTAAKDPSPSRN